jgi:hypothetical protein
VTIKRFSAALDVVMACLFLLNGHFAVAAGANDPLLYGSWLHHETPESADYGLTRDTYAIRH